MGQVKIKLPVAHELRLALIKIITEGMVTEWNEDYSPKPTLHETFKPPCPVCASMKKIASEALGVKPFWEDNAEELNDLIKERTNDVTAEDQEK